MIQINEITPLEIELIKRFANSDDPKRYESGLYWIASGLTQVTTETAFQLARGGRNVYIVDNDCDYQLDDIETLWEYYSDLKTYPEIESIFLVEGKL